MRMFPLRVILLLLLLVYYSQNPPQAWANGPLSKPLPPLQISITPSQTGITTFDIHPGDTVEFKIAATSSITVSKMHIEVELTNGAELVSGDTSWTGPAMGGEEKSISLTVRAPVKGRGKVSARALISGNSMQSFSAEARYQLGGEDARKTEPQPLVKKDGKGRNVIEYR